MQYGVEKHGGHIVNGTSRFLSVLPEAILLRDRAGAEEDARPSPVTLAAVQHRVPITVKRLP